MRYINSCILPGALHNDLWSLELEIWFHEYDLAVLSLHQLDELDCVARCGRDARPGLHVTDHVQIEMLSKIGKRAMIGDYLAAMVWPHFLVPFLLGCSQPLVKVLKLLLEVSGVIRIHLGELVGDAASDAPAIVGIEPVVRVSERVNIAHSTRDCAGGDFQDFGKLGRIQIARSANLYLRIAALRDEWGQPTNLKL